MGLIREPLEIDFTLISKAWTAEDEKEFSELIKKQKNKKQLQTIFLNTPYKNRATEMVPA